VPGGEEQLSLVPDTAIQGQLFVEPSEALDEVNAESGAEPAPKRRRRHPGPKASLALAAGDSDGSAGEANSSAAADLPPWHHHSLVDAAALPPMLRHYVELKAAHPERVLLYRLGDFFECFFEDALLVSRVLELTLTGKEGGKSIGRVPMAGIPHHASERYCAELVRRGHAVALCDQVETNPVKGALLRREITRVLTPGTVLEEGLLAARRNNWLAALVLSGDEHWGLAVADVSTGEFRVCERQGLERLQQELLQLEAAELLLAGLEQQQSRPDWCPDSLSLTPQPRTPFEKGSAEHRLRQRYGLPSLEGLGLAQLPLALRAAGGLVAYLDDSQPGTTLPLELPLSVFAGDALVIDHQTRRNLELTATQRDGLFQGSLLWALDRTHTAMGARALRRWLEAPLLDAAAINDRQEAIGQFIAERPLRLSIRRLLRPMADLERLAGRCAAGSASARDLVALADGLERLPLLADLLRHNQTSVLQPLAQPRPQLASLAALLRHQLVDSPPLSLSEGGLIHDGVDENLDDLRNRLDEQENWLAEVERRERQSSGNPNLRLQFHRSFGYFLAVSRAKAAAVPDHWIRRQTLSNEERFVTPELKEREGRILQLRARTQQREYDLFCLLRQRVGELASGIREAARAVAHLDALAGLAELAATQGYCRPQISNNRCLEIEAGRHPVVEQLLCDQPFVANAIALGQPHPDLIVLTGPNASGKSCYLRQTGVLQLMAQMGSWIPASRACFGLADRIFTRVGAVDDLASGQSTFMVEMAETANILRHASDRSLVLLDEIGRGTATFDGLSIAWAVAEHLASEIQARTVFATHYHELNALAAASNRVANFQVAVEERGDTLVFLHRVVPGGADRSYGIEAARLAGVPSPVVQRARQLLERIESGHQLLA
jgi:DNA mismatch repair protein MutS